MMQLRTYLFILTAWLLTVMPAGAGEPPRIEVRVASQVNGETILLGDIASITASPLVKGILSDLSLGRSPKPGKSMTIRKREFQASLRAHQELLDQAVLTLPEVIYIKRGSQTVSEAQVRDEVDAYLEQYFTGRPFEVEALALPVQADYPKGLLEIRIMPGQKVGRNGKFTFHADIFVENRKKDRIRLSGRVVRHESVVCAMRDMAAGETLSPETIRLEQKNVLTIRGAVVTDAGPVQGMALKTDVRMGEPILKDWLEQVPVVRKGDAVTLVARKNNLVIVTSGISKEDGFENRMIRVENIGSGKVVRGLVKEGSTVEVVF